MQLLVLWTRFPDILPVNLSASGSVSFFFFFFFYHSASLPRGLNEVGYSLSRVVSANNGVAAFQFGSIRERWWACRRVHTSRPPVSRLFGVHTVHPPFSFSLFFFLLFHFLFFDRGETQTWYLTVCALCNGVRINLINLFLHINKSTAPFAGVLWFLA